MKILTVRLKPLCKLKIMNMKGISNMELFLNYWNDATYLHTTISNLKYWRQKTYLFQCIWQITKQMQLFSVIRVWERSIFVRNWIEYFGEILHHSNSHLIEDETHYSPSNYIKKYELISLLRKLQKLLKIRVKNTVFQS